MEGLTFLLFFIIFIQGFILLARTKHIRQTLDHVQAELRSLRRQAKGGSPVIEEEEEAEFEAVPEIPFEAPAPVVVPKRPEPAKPVCPPPPPQHVFIPHGEPAKPEPVEPVSKPWLESEPQPAEVTPSHPPKSRLQWEQWVGTRGLLVVGIIATLIGTGLFLKYAYDGNLIGPGGRVMITTLAGALALGLGEWTRRRDYGVVARGLTALGFAILYASIFSAYQLYHLLGATPSFGLSILITAAALAYAVSLDDILPAFVAMLGGYLAPLLLSTGENRPHALFGYLCVLGLGTMACAVVRKWRAVNALVFVGTFLLYTGWFTKFYHPAIRAAGNALPDQWPAATLWLTVFFLIFLLTPILFNLAQRVPARREDVGLVLGNALVVLGFYTEIFYHTHRQVLAFVVLGMAVAHLALMYVVARRSSQDISLRLIMLVISLFLVTLAIPLYLKMYAVAMAWAAEAVCLTFIGQRYRSKLSQAGGLLALALSVFWLVNQLPLHEAAFTLVWNRAFGSWLFVIAAAYGVHLLYRRAREICLPQAYELTQILYGIFWLLSFCGLALEWYAHVKYNLRPTGNTFSSPAFCQGLMVLATLFMMLCVVRPVCPAHSLWPALGTTTALAGSAFLVVLFSDFYRGPFTLFANLGFVLAMVQVAGVFGCAALFHRQWPDLTGGRRFIMAFVLGGIILLWLVLTEQIYIYWYQVGLATKDMTRANFMGHMYVSVLWAIYAAGLMVVGFWRRLSILRYVSLGIFGLVLVKVFIFDTAHLKSIYRIAGFVVLGLILVGMSYLYQYARKSGHFSFDTPGDKQGNQS